MRKEALIVCVVVLGLVFTQAAIGQEEELKVPFGAIKPSCYGDIDSSKTEFALSEVGRGCVVENWLKKNAPKHETEVEEHFEAKTYGDTNAVKLSWNDKLLPGELNSFGVKVYDESYIHSNIEGNKEETITFLVFHNDPSGWGESIQELPKQTFQGPGGYVEKTELPVEKEKNKWVGEIKVRIQENIKGIGVWKKTNTSKEGHYGLDFELISDTKTYYSGDFDKLINQLNTPEKLVEYMAKNFDHWMNREDIKSYQFKPYPPEVFYKRGVGDCGNFAIFATYVLDQHGYETEQIYYRAKALNRDETIPHNITVFRDKEDNRLYYISNAGGAGSETGFKVFGPFTSKSEIISREEWRLSASLGQVEVFLIDNVISGSIGRELNPESFAEATEILNTPLKIGNYIARNFEFERAGGPTKTPKELFRSEKGNWYDFVVFISYLLEKNSYETNILRLDFTIDGRKWNGSKHIGENDIIVIYRDEDGMLRSINQQATVDTRISQPYESMEALIEHQEKQRTLFPYTEGEIKIYRYALLEPGTTDLEPRKWEIHFKP